MQINIDKEYIIRIRRELHKVPELEFDLPKTLAIVRKELDALGIPYTEELGQSSIVATLNAGKGTKTIGLRADMDALPIQEETGLEFSSTHPGKMHACGHDCHTAMLLGTAKALKEMEQEVPCCVKFVFQASEEGPSGAKKLCDSGLMKDIDMMVGCHVVPGYVPGSIHLNKTCANACSHGVRIHLHGKSTHASTPQYGVDAIAMAVKVYTDIQVMRARGIDPFEPVIINIGELHSGHANNIVSYYAVMSLTIRSLKNEVDARIYQKIQKIAESAASMMGGSAEVETYKFSPALINDHGVADGIIEAARKIVTEDKLITNKPLTMGAEDFAYYTLEKPGAIFFLGVTPYDGVTASLHNGKMLVNEDVLDVTPKVFVQFVLDQGK